MAPLRERGQRAFVEGLRCGGDGGSACGRDEEWSGFAAPAASDFANSGKSPKRRLETKVSKTFLCLLRGTSFFRRRVGAGLCSFLRRCRWLGD